MDYNGITRNDINAVWIPINFNGDTGWVYRGENPCIRIDMESYNDLELLHFYTIGEYGGEQYYSTKVNNIIKGSEMDISMYRDHSKKVKDDLYLFSTTTEEIMLYNSPADSMIYTSMGTLPVISKDGLIIYFFRLYYDQKLPTQLICYNCFTWEEKLLYQDTDNTAKPCIYYDDGFECKDIEVLIDNKGISFELYKLKEIPIDEGDVIRYKITINSDGANIRKNILSN